MPRGSGGTSVALHSASPRVHGPKATNGGGLVIHASRGGSIRAIGFVTALAVLGTAALAGSPRLVVEMDEPFTLQGRICRPGLVSIRLVAPYTPNAALHEVCVADECLGVFLADRTSFASDGRQDALRFERGA